MSRASNPLPDTIYAIQHLAFEDLGHWEDIFYQLGFRVRYFEAGVEDLTQALTYAGLPILLGGPIAVYDTPDYPFLQPEIENKAMKANINFIIFFIFFLLFAKEIKTSLDD